MPDQTEGRGIVVRLCPDCGGHLGDTWDEDDDACGRCGFRYVANVRQRDVASRGAGPTTAADRLLSTAYGTAGLLAAWGAGAALAGQEWVTSTATGSIEVGAPGVAAWTTIVLGVIAAGLVVAALRRAGL